MARDSAHQDCACEEYLAIRPDGFSGVLIVNADDWGQNRETTNRISECLGYGNISSASAMVFMEDSVRAADMAQQMRIDTGLHLNFTTPFSGRDCPPQLAEHQNRIGKCLMRHRFSQAIFHPALVRSFEYLVMAQIAEYQRLYGVRPRRLDGHHHMHLCPNVLLGGLLPAETIVRRNFSFQAGEKYWCNRVYRRFIDKLLARRHHLTDFFFSLSPLEPASRLKKIFGLANQCVVEVETHPVNRLEFEFLARGQFQCYDRHDRIAPRFMLEPKRLVEAGVS